MSTLNNIQSNPFVNHGEQLTTDLIEYQIINQMPRSLASPSDFDKNQTLDLNSVQNSSKKRKFHNDNEDNIFITPVHKSHGVVITPPKSSSNKRLKTFPQSPMVSGYPSFSEIYQTPKTPTHNADYKIGDGSPIDYSISNPQHYTANFLSTRNNNFSDVDVTPPHSQSNSPNQKFAKLALPSVRLQRSTPGYHQFYYPDTCYSFNIGGGSVKPSADNTKRNVWREQCEYKLRHELNREMKEYATLTETLKQQNAKRLDESVYNPPSYNDPVLFPNMIKMNNIVSSFPEQPDIGNFKYDHQKLNEDAELLLKLRNNSKNSREKSEFMNKNSKYNNRFSLPSIKHLLNLQPIDKSCILPSVLSTSEIKQFKNTAKCGFVFDNQADFFSNGTQIKYNNPVTEQMEDLQRQRQRETDNFFNIYYQRQKLYQPQNQVFGSQYHASSIPATQNSNLHNVTESTQKPIFSVHTNISSNACDDFAKSISKDENCIETTNDIKIQPLIIPKNRKVTSKSSPKNSNKKVPAKNARSRSSSRGSKASSRSTSGSSAKSKKAASSTSKSSVTAVVNKPRTRSSTTNSTRCSSIDSTKTAELPASVHTSPKRSPVTHNNGLTDLELHHSHIYHENRFPIVLNQTQNIKPMKAQEAKVKPLKFSITSVQSNKTTVKSNSSHHVHENIVKKCVSCHSSDSPCWRPSWSKDEGQLCNSCGLRYRKTKARCCNVKCLKIPSKSEWSLMEKRGKISAHIYSKEGEISGETVGYRCLDCDSVVEVQ